MAINYTPRTSFIQMNTKETIKKNGLASDAAAAAMLQSKKTNSRVSPTLLQELKGAGSRLGESTMTEKTTKTTPISEQEAAILRITPGAPGVSPAGTGAGSGTGSFGEYQEAELQVSKPTSVSDDYKKEFKKYWVIGLVVVAVVVVGYLIWKKPWKKTR